MMSGLAVMELSAVISRVWPSGGALHTASVPGTVAPPGRLSTSTGWPQAAPSLSAMARASVSSPPPAGKGTISRVGRPCCASAGAAMVMAGRERRAKLIG